MKSKSSEGKGIKREIKFRVFAGYKMEYFELGDDVPYYYPDENSPAVKHKPVMQYTGLKDKNGKDIYEGDLIECAYCKKEYGEVVWNKEMLRFELKWKDENCGNARHTRIDDWSNVVGNIYQNPELLINHPTHH